MLLVVASGPLCAGPGSMGATEVVITNFTQLEPLILGKDGVAVSVDLVGQILWANPARGQFVLQVGTGIVRVKNLFDQPMLRPGQQVRVTGHGLAGNGFLDQAVVDSDGLHSVAEKTGAVYLTAGRHPLYAEYFNGSADSVFTVEYAGPGLERQSIPGNALYRVETNAASGAPNWLPGLSYRCYEGIWNSLPTWPELEPVKTGCVTNFDLRVRTRDQQVALQFTGYLQVEREGLYTFWTKSDDGSRLFVGSSPLRLEALGVVPFPKARDIQSGQALKPEDDLFWAVTEGVVTETHVDIGGALELELCAGTNRMYLILSDASSLHAPSRFSRIRVTGLCRNLRLAGGGCVAGRLLVSDPGLIEELAPAPISKPHVVTTLAELRHLAADAQRTMSLFCLTGSVVTAVSPKGNFAFQDDTGGMVVRISEHRDLVKPGQQIILKGSGVLDGDELILNHAAVVDNDGVHALQEQFGAVYLTAGWHPIHLSWFNSAGEFGLEVYYQRAGLPRTRIPNSALVHPEIEAGGSIKWVAGLNYTYFAGDCIGMPTASELEPVEIGRAANFDTQVVSRREKLSLEFDGYLEIAQGGLYFFSVNSDDGSLLFIDEQPLQIETVSSHRLPAPLPLISRQILGPGQTDQWSETEGTVNFVSERAGSLFLDLDSIYGPMTVKVVDGTGGSPLLMLGAQVKVQGFCQGALVPDGPNLAVAMTVPGMKQVQLLEADPLLWNQYPLSPIGDVAETNFMSAGEAIAHIRGEAQADPATGRLRLRDASGTIDVETIQPLTTNLNGRVEVIGQLKYTQSNVLLQCGIGRRATGGRDEASNPLPLLTTIQQIKQLTREQALRRYPVKIRGVVTLVRAHGSGVIIQSDTSAIDVWWRSYSTASLPKVGDYWEIEGETSVKFSPIIESRRAVRLGGGVMPEPLRPAWDQLLNGSLDTRYVEIQGIVTAAEGDAVVLFTHAGKVRVPLSPAPAEPLKSYENALVRIRGCVVPARDEKSQQVQVGQFRLSNMTMNVDKPAPTDLFQVGLKHVAELLLFDAQADSLRRVKIAGQLLHVDDHELFVTEGLHPIRVESHDPVNYQSGDLVEVVGFPELGGSTPVLREAILRRVGVAPLPTPVHISGEALFTNGYDGMLISTEARLAGVSGDMWEKVLQLQVGNQEFLARLESSKGALMDLLPGSRLELTGVYSEQVARQVSGKGITSFELLLNSPSAVKVLQRPPWWTLRRALIFIGGMACIISVAMLWIFLLQRRVEARSAQLEAEVLRREQFQRQSQLEKERIRIARDMHDQLGVNVTQVGLLAALIRKNIGESGELAANVEKISQTTVELGRSLDEIVWAVNPKNDSLNKFCDYMAVQAQELFQLTDILCRVDLPPEMPYHPLCAEVRHNLFLAVKEALNNVVRHARAQEVWIRFKLEAAQFQISIMDDGVGMVPEQKESLRNGLNNIQKRMEDIGGHFTIQSQPNQGTQLTLGVSVSLMAKKFDGAA